MRIIIIRSKISKFFSRVCIFLLFFSVLHALSGCAQKPQPQSSQLDKARDYVKESRDYYQRAVAQYQDLIVQGEDSEQANFELGLLYYQGAEYELASQCLAKTESAQAKKYRAVALFKSGDYTEARDAFKKIDKPDSEALYYQGQTCEKLNLHDQALEIYRRVSQEPYRTLSQKQIQLITREGEDLYLEGIDPQLQEIIKSAPRQEKYPNAGALILFCDEEIELSPQNTAVFSGHVLIKILNERGKQDFSEIVLGYDSTYEKVELEYARTIRPDGLVVAVGSRHIRDVSKYLNFPLYSNARARIISFPEVTEGCVIEYKYKVYRNQLINEEDIVLSYSLQESEPIIQASFKLALPVSKPLHHKILNPAYNTFQAKLEPEVKEASGYREYSWEFKDIPAIIPEADMPPVSKINSVILLSTFDSWQEVYDWWWNLARDKIQADAAIKQKVADLTGDEEDIQDKIRAVYNFCAEDIRYVAVEYGQAGHEPHKAADIFANKYGDCKDQAILLITMLREIGVGAYPVLIGTDDYLNLEEDLPSVNFNHAIAAVQLEDGLIFLDPTCETCSFQDLPSGDQDRKVLIFTEQGYRIETTPLYPAEHNRVRRILKMRIDSDEKIHAEREVFTFGLYNAGQRFWLKYSSDDAISESLKQAIQGISQRARLIQYDILNLDDLNENLVLVYSFSGQDYWTKAGNLRIFPQLAILDTAVVAKQIRRYPLDLGMPETTIVELQVALPSNFKLKHLPKNFQKNNPWADFSVEYRLEEGQFYFKQITRAKKRYVTLSEYSEFKEFLEGISTQIRQRVVFQSN
ncbi:DUF3857 domain-containing protein [Candidatus Omnitrophota bacterium]